MSVLKSYFDRSVNQNDKVSDTYLLVSKVGKDGESIMVPEKIDYKKIQESHGTVDEWSLDNLLKAGINPASLSVHTGINSRLDGINDINAVLSEIPEEPVVETPKTEE